MKRRHRVSQADIARMFDVDIASGIIKWRHPERRSDLIGKRAGCIQKASGSTKRTDSFYRSIVFGPRGNRTIVKAHQIIWAKKTGKWPHFDIDHVNGDGLDDRIDNLRRATRSQNLCNARLSLRNTSGVKWVSQRKTTGEWIVQIRHLDKRIFKSFSERDVAIEFARKTAQSLHGSFYRSGA